MKGYFISVEGTEGSGKSTLLQTLAIRLQEKGYDVIVTREPGGIEIAEQIRHILLDPKNINLESRTEALLYAAARRQHLVEKVIPALEKGAIVLCDRFIDSSLVYQGIARGLGIDEILAINHFAIEGNMPEITLYIDLEPEKGLARIQQNEEREYNRLDQESLEFHKQVYEGYAQLLKQFPNRIVQIDGNCDRQTLVEKVESVLKEKLNL